MDTLADDYGSSDEDNDVKGPSDVDDVDDRTSHDVIQSNKSPIAEDRPPFRHSSGVDDHIQQDPTNVVSRNDPSTDSATKSPSLVLFPFSMDIMDRPEDGEGRPTNTASSKHEMIRWDPGIEPGLLNRWAALGDLPTSNSNQTASHPAWSRWINLPQPYAAHVQSSNDMDGFMDDLGGKSNGTPHDQDQHHDTTMDRPASFGSNIHLLESSNQNVWVPSLEELIQQNEQARRQAAEEQQSRFNMAAS